MFANFLLQIQPTKLWKIYKAIALMHYKYLTLFVAGLMQTVHTKTAVSHIAFCEHNSSMVNTRELFNSSRLNKSCS